MAPEYVSFLSPFMYLALMSEKTTFAVFQSLDEEDEDEGEDEDDEEVRDLSESLPLVLPFGFLAMPFPAALSIRFTSGSSSEKGRLGSLILRN